MKHCSGCDQYLELNAFGKDRRKKDGLRYTCRDCRGNQRSDKRAADNTKHLEYEHQPEVKRKSRNSSLKRSYKITLEEYERMLLIQNNVCKLCGLKEQHKTKKNLTVDHCHISGKVRGLLCHRCNCTIGLARENTVVLKNMISYLEGKIC